jgi:hypothetical protein
MSVLRWFRSSDKAEERPEVRMLAIAGAKKVREGDPALIDTLKTLLDDYDLSSVTATRRTDASNWRTVTVREQGLLDEDSADGFVTVIEDGGL